MKENATRLLARARESMAGISAGQKVIAGVGVLALLLAGFMVFRWVATPSYSPLYSQMSSEDAAAVIEELTATGVPHKLSDDGNTVLVPKEQVHETRIALSGEGLPANSGDGYSLLDEQSLSTSQFQEQTSFKRAMEGELASTIEAIDGVSTAVVHLAMPAKQVFAKEQDPTTASVLVDTQAGKAFTPDQVQAVVHLVASSVDGLAPEKVTVADASGRVLSADAASGGLGAGTRNQAIQEHQDELNAKIQRTLDTVVGPGNSTVAVTADLDFDKSVSTSTTYESDPEAKPLSSNRQRESYTGPGAPGVGGVVGPEGNTELDGNGNGNGTYAKNSTTEDNAVNSVVERRESAPGAVDSLHIGVALDSNAPIKVSNADMRRLIAAAIGEDLDRGDTVEVTSMPFDRSAQEAAEAELAAAEKAEAKAARLALIRNLGIGVVVVMLGLLAWLQGRRRARARADATHYVVEQLRRDAQTRADALPEAPNPALTALESAEQDEVEKMRDELTALVERQPEDVAALLRGWLVEPPR